MVSRLVSPDPAPDTGAAIIASDPATVEMVDKSAPAETARKTLVADIRYAARLLKRYFSADPWVGGALVAGELALGGLTAFTMLRLQLAVASMTNALAGRRGAEIPTLLLTIGLILVAVLAVSLSNAWVTYTLRMRTRTVLTGDALDTWLSGRRFYFLGYSRAVDHPEQRIQEDLFVFVEQVLLVAPSILMAFTSVLLFGDQLWKISPPISFDLGGQTWQFTGSLFYLACVFTIAWTLLTHWLGSSLSRAEIVRQGLEAQFRQEMASIRDNSEAVAFERGEAAERTRLGGTFDLIRLNWRRYTAAQVRVIFCTTTPNLLFMIVPFFILGPQILAGRKEVGDLQLASAGFQSVFTALGIFIMQYQQLAILRSAVSRLRHFDEAMHEAGDSGVALAASEDDRLRTRDLLVRYPDGAAMLAVGDLELPSGARLLIKGRSGAGKSTLLRAMAGLWQYGSGEVSWPCNAKICFLPQRCYMPDGTLLGLLAYPRGPEAVSREECRELLERLGLQRIEHRLDEVAEWRRILSPGEQQRVAIARAVLTRADFVIVDEATSALDLHSEAICYTLLAEHLPNATIISVAHKPSLDEFHDIIVTISDGRLDVSAWNKPAPSF